MAIRRYQWQPQSPPPPAAKTALHEEPLCRQSTMELGWKEQFGYAVQPGLKLQLDPFHEHVPSAIGSLRLPNVFAGLAVRSSVIAVFLSGAIHLVAVLVPQILQMFEMTPKEWLFLLVLSASIIPTVELLKLLQRLRIVGAELGPMSRRAGG